MQRSSSSTMVSQARYRIFFLATTLALGGWACGATLPRPPLGEQPGGVVFTQVPYPPPPARVEVIPPRPNDTAVWIDGQWAWQGTQWQWESGGWVIPPQGAYFAPWAVVRRSDGSLGFAVSSWYAQGKAIPAPPRLITVQAAPSADETSTPQSSKPE